VFPGTLYTPVTSNPLASTILVQRSTIIGTNYTKKKKIVISQNIYRKHYYYSMISEVF
jgi:hypothetical protein